MQTAIDYRQQIADELEVIPDNELAELAQIVHVYRKAHCNPLIDNLNDLQKTTLKAKLDEANEDIKLGRISQLDMDSIIQEAKAEYNQGK